MKTEGCGIDVEAVHVRANQLRSTLSLDRVDNVKSNPNASDAKSSSMMVEVEEKRRLGSEGITCCIEYKRVDGGGRGRRGIFRTQ